MLKDIFKVIFTFQFILNNFQAYLELYNFLIIINSTILLVEIYIYDFI